MVYVLILAVIVIFIAFIYKKSRNEVNLLKRRYRQLTFLSPSEVDKSLQLQIDRLKSKYPGRSEKWYLEKVIYDLERDRR